MNLRDEDIARVVKRLPREVEATLKQYLGRACVGGGFIRDVLSGARPSDLDIFTRDDLTSDQIAGDLATRLGGAGIHVGPHALTIHVSPAVPKVQIVKRWHFEQPHDIADRFDFTVCCAAIWWLDPIWCALAHANFYPDLAAKRLVYTRPTLGISAEGTLTRVVRFIRRGYWIDNESLAWIATAAVVGAAVDCGFNIGEPADDGRIAGRVLARMPKDGYQ